MKLGSLFSGGGLGDFGFMAAGIDIRWQCEIDSYCQKILALRYPDSKKYTDIKLLRGSEIEKVDILTGGFPCQPFSVAGKQKGKEDSRYLWPEMLRIIKECRPRWIIGENVTGIINLALDTICANLEAENYEVWPIIFPSHAIGAWHKRDRLWLICHTKYDGQFASKEPAGVKERGRNSKAWKNETSESKGSSEQYASMANSRCESKREEGKRFDNQPEYSGTPWLWTKAGDRLTNGGWWATEPSVGRVANGITNRVHRLRMLGNGQVPACTYVIGKMIMQIEGSK